MRTPGEITKQIKDLAMEQGEYEVDQPEFVSLSNRIKALQQTLVVVYNATHVNQVAYVNERGSITIE